MKRKVLTGGYAYDNLLPRRRFTEKRLVKEGLQLLAQRTEEQRATQMRRIERAIEADWLCDAEIAEELGTSTGHISDIRRQLHLRRTSRWGRTTDGGRWSWGQEDSHIRQKRTRRNNDD